MNRFTKPDAFSAFAAAGICVRNPPGGTLRRNGIANTEVEMNPKTTKSRAVKDRTHGGRRRHRSGCCSAVAAGPSQAAATSASVTSAGIVDIPDHAQRADLSGVTGVGDKLLIVNDRTPNKDVGQAVYTAPTDFRMAPTLTPMTGLPNIDVQKLEGITTTPERRLRRCNHGFRPR